MCDRACWVVYLPICHSLNLSHSFDLSCCELTNPYYFFVRLLWFWIFNNILTYQQSVDIDCCCLLIVCDLIYWWAVDPVLCQHYLCSPHGLLICNIMLCFCYICLYFIIFMNKFVILFPVFYQSCRYKRCRLMLDLWVNKLDLQAKSSVFWH